MIFIHTDTGKLFLLGDHTYSNLITSDSLILIDEYEQINMYKKEYIEFIGWL